MLAVTDQAREYLVEMLDEQEAPPGVIVRLVFAGPGLTPELDNAHRADTTFEHAGRTVLALDEEMAELLEDNTLDVEAAPAGPRLTIR